VFTPDGMATLIGRIPTTGSSMNRYIACGSRDKGEIERLGAVLESF
jgi:hypothetical protein